PRYDYNQIMYKLDLDDPRLVLPVPIYDVARDDKANRFATRPQLASGAQRRIAFFALDRPHDGAVPVFAEGSEGRSRLRIGESASTRSNGAGAPLFYVLDASAKAAPATVVPLYEFINDGDGTRTYSTDAALQTEGFRREKQPLGLVWPNPLGTELN
ncbi:MAG TPA: hypothetical protein VGM03_06445, partial [Phycisphaerae bacterium]